MTSVPMVSLRNVSKAFGAFPAIDDVSFEVGRGEFFSLLGPSGCGKTTLLRLIGGFEVPSAGEILIDNQAMTAVPPNRRPTNTVFQSYAIFPHLSVRQNVAYGLSNKGLGRRHMDDKVEDALAMIQMSEHGDRRPDQLSGGQRQRVALARSLVCDPKVLLLDEPLAALDKKLRKDMQIELRRIQRSVGITFILVTHDQEEALALSDRIAVIHAGKVMQIGSANELYEQPTSRIVADFIGTMNFITARVLEPANGRLVADLGGAGKVSLQGIRARAGAELTLAIRPEKIHLAWTRPSLADGVMEGQVVAASYLGDRYHYCVQVPGLPEPLWVVSQTTERCLARPSIEARRVWLSLPAEALIPMDGG